MKRIAASAMLAGMVAGGFTPAQAEDVWSSPPVPLAAIQVVVESGVVRLGVRPRRLPGLPEFNFNPAGCPIRTVAYHLGAEDSATGQRALEDTHILDLPLQSDARTAAEHDELLRTIYGAFMTNRRVRLLVPDDRCTAAGVRVVVGIRVVD